MLAAQVSAVWSHILYSGNLIQYQIQEIRAEDTILIFVGDSLGELNSEINEKLEKVPILFSTSELTVNIQLQGKISNYNYVSLYANNEQIKHVTSLKYLGMHFGSGIH